MSRLGRGGVDPRNYATTAIELGREPVRCEGIDIRLASGIVISVGRCVEIEPLRRVLTALAVQ